MLNHQNKRYQQLSVIFTVTGILKQSLNFGGGQGKGGRERRERERKERGRDGWKEGREGGIFGYFGALLCLSNLHICAV